MSERDALLATASTTSKAKSILIPEDPSGEPGFDPAFQRPHYSSIQTATPDDGSSSLPSSSARRMLLLAVDRARQKFRQDAQSYQHGDGELQNSGSVARDHMANERTVLAYLRTGLSLASAGVGISVLMSRLASEKGLLAEKTARRFPRLIGAVFGFLGLLFFVIGTYRYFLVQSSLKKGQFSPSIKHALVLSAFVGAALCAAAGVVVILPR